MKQHKKTEEKKRNILTSALKCFIKHGVENTSIQMICEETQTSVGSLYHHFGNKEAIAAAVYIEAMKDFSELVDTYLDNLGEKAKAEAVIKSLVYANADWISQNKDWARYVFKNKQVVNDGKTKEKLDKDSKRFFSNLAPIIDEFVQTKQIKALPLSLYHSIITGPVHDYARFYLIGRYKKPVSEYRDEFAQAAWDAIKY